MTLAELTAKCFRARLKRRLARGYTLGHTNLIKKCESRQVQKAKFGKCAPVRTHLRDMPILPCMVGLNMAVYNGRKFVEFDVKFEHIAFNLGEFAPTYQFVRHRTGPKAAAKFVPAK